MNQERRGARPYGYHYDGALFDGPDQYVNLMVSADGILQSEVLEDDEENDTETLDDDPEKKASSSGKAVENPVTLVRQPSYVSEPKGYLQVTNSSGGQSETRVSVAELLETLPSMDEEAFIQPVPCESELYDKWARIPRTEAENRASATRSITVTAKSWTILQSMQSPSQVPSEATPTTNPSLLALADEECNTLDSIINHYNTMLLVQSGDRPTAAKLHHIDPKPSQLEIKKFSNLEADATSSDKRLPLSLSPLPKKQQTTNINPLSVTQPSPNASPVTTKRHQVVPTASANIEWPSGRNQSDKIYQMARLWSWKPSKTLVQRNFKAPVENAEQTQKFAKKDKPNARQATKKSRPDAMTTNTKPAAAAVNARITAQLALVSDVTENLASASNSRFQGFRANPMNENTTTPTKTDNTYSDISRANLDRLLRLDDAAKNRPGGRVNNVSLKEIPVPQAKAILQTRNRPKATRPADLSDSMDTSTSPTPRLNLRLKNQKEDSRTMNFNLRGRSSNPKPVN